jgi:methenyltetrahydromethanopterin cyclohydrolase
MVRPTEIKGVSIQINYSISNQGISTMLFLVTDSSKVQNAYREAPASPLNMIWVEDIGKANIVTFIMIKAEVIYHSQVKREEVIPARIRGTRYPGR